MLLKVIKYQYWIQIWNYLSRWLFVYVLPITILSLNASGFNTMALSIERFLLIKCNKVSNNFLYYIIPILCVSIAFNIPRFFELEYVELTDGYGYIKGTDMRLSYNYILYYLNVANLIINAIIPMMTVTVLNAWLAKILVMKQKIWREMTSSTQRDHRLTIVLLILAFVFVLCNSFRFGLNIYELIIHLKVRCTWSTKLDMQQHWCYIFQVLIFTM